MAGGEEGREEFQQSAPLLSELFDKENSGPRQGAGAGEGGFTLGNKARVIIF